MKSVLSILTMILAIAGTRLSAQNNTSNPPDTVIIQRLMTPLPLDSLSISYDSPESVSFMTLIRLSLFGRTDAARKASIDAFHKASRSKIPIELGLSYIGLSNNALVSITIDTCMKNAVAIFEKENLPNLKMLAQLYAARTLVNTGGNYVNAFKMTNQFIETYKVKEDFRSYSIAWNTLGEIYRLILDDRKAMESYKKAAAFAYRSNKLINAAPLINMGTIYKNLGKYDSAFFFYDLVLALDTLRYDSRYAYVLNRKAQIYLLTNNHQEAYNHVTKSLSLYERINNEQGIVLALSTFTQLYHDQRNFQDCVKSGERAINLAMKIEFFPIELIESCKLVVDVFEQNKVLSKAIHYQKIHDSIYAKLFGPSVNLQMFNEQLGLENRNQELEKSLLIELQKQREDEIKNQRLILFIILAALALSLITLLLVFSKNRVIRTLNFQLQERQDEILAQTEELKATNEEIESINSNLENLVKERNQKVLLQNEKLTEYAYFNAHKVRTPLTRILELINRMEISLKEETVPYSEMLKQAGIDLDHSIREINSIIEKDESGNPLDNDSHK